MYFSRTLKGKNKNRVYYEAHICREKLRKASKGKENIGKDKTKSRTVSGILVLAFMYDMAFIMENIEVFNYLILAINSAKLLTIPFI